MKAYKFRISSPEQSERLQKSLFKLSYSWPGENCIKYLESLYLYTDEGGNIYCGNLSMTFTTAGDYKEKDTEKFLAKHSQHAVKDRKSKWHSVKDGLPEKTNQCYLVYCASNGCQFTAQVDNVTGRWHEWTFGPSDVINSYHPITHWRKLPKSPKG